jgi:hypothetical protein
MVRKLVNPSDFNIQKINPNPPKINLSPTGKGRLVNIRV